MNASRPLAVSLVTAALAAAFCGAVQAQVRITEVAPWSSSIAAVGADWFEVTNFGSTAVSLSGWKMDDNSYAFTSAVALNGASGWDLTLAPSESAIFIEGTSATATSFVTNWFSGSAPAGFKIGFYAGSGVGLSSAGDGVILFDVSSATQARVGFGASPSASPFATFDNAAGLDGSSVTLSTLSVVGVNGAFSVVHGATTEIGSPGVAPIPEPEVYAFALAGLALGGLARRRRARVASAT